LELAEIVREGPWKKPRKRKGAIAKGLAYEKKFGQELIAQLKDLKRAQPLDTVGGQFFSSQWIWFEDANGEGYAQPDYFIYLPAVRKVLLFECKLTQCASGYAQLRELYSPLLRYIFNTPPIMCLVAKNLSRTAPYAAPIERLTALMKESPDKIYLWHHIH
jgi:hypothetical protein